MWVPNSERGHKMPPLEGENEIPHIPKLDFLAKMRFLGWNDQKMRVGIWRQVAFYPVYLPTYYRYFNSEECILILIEFPLIWYIVGLCWSKFGLIFKFLNHT